MREEKIVLIPSVGLFLYFLFSNQNLNKKMKKEIKIIIIIQYKLSDRLISPHNLS